MKAIIVLSITCFVLCIGLLWCIHSIHCLCRAIDSILETTAVHDKILGLEK